MCNIVRVFHSSSQEQCTILLQKTVADAKFFMLPGSSRDSDPPSTSSPGKNRMTTQLEQTQLECFWRSELDEYGEVRDQHDRLRAAGVGPVLPFDEWLLLQPDDYLHCMVTPSSVVSVASRMKHKDCTFRSRRLDKGKKSANSVCGKLSEDGQHFEYYSLVEMVKHQSFPYDDAPSETFAKVVAFQQIATDRLTHLAIVQSSQPEALSLIKADEIASINFVLLPYDPPPDPPPVPGSNPQFVVIQLNRSQAPGVLR